MQDRHRFKVLNTEINKIYENIEDLSKEEPNAHFLLTQDGCIIKKYYNNNDLMLIRMDIYKPLFCTSLKDKNDRLIFEGDIVQHSDDKSISEIIFCENCNNYSVFNRFDVEMIEVSEGVEESYCYGCDNTDFKWFVNKKILEVIGNIYDDKHLLKY